MKRRYIILTIIISIILTVLIGIILTKETKKEDYKSVTDYDYLCTYEASMSDEEGESNKKITKNLYLSVNDEEYVTSATYESIYDNDYFTNSLKDLTQDVLNLYNEIDGVETSIETHNKKSYVLIKYDYNKINFKNLKKTLKDILDEDSLQVKMKSKIKVNEYIQESSEYSCIKK